MLAGKVIIVTGGSAGIGAAIVDACLAAGGSVLSADISPPRSLEHPCLASVVASVSTPEGQRAIVSAALARFSRIDGLVNNAGVNLVKDFLATTEGDWDRTLSVDLKGVFFLSQAVVREAVAAGRPLSIVNVSSVHSLAGMAGAGPYDAAKAGVVGMTRALAVELAPKGIRVNAVSPGAVRTLIWDDIVAAAKDRKAFDAYWSAQTPMGRVIEPEEVAAPIVFLLSSGASAMTGTNLVVDAGMLAQLLSTAPYESEEIRGK
jgi:2-deoxy-D-gluconate 3-dehydrogenase